MQLLRVDVWEWGEKLGILGRLGLCVPRHWLRTSHPRPQTQTQLLQLIRTPTQLQKNKKINSGSNEELRIWCWKAQMCNLENVEGWKFLALWVNVWEQKLNWKFTFWIKNELCDQAAQLWGDFTFVILLLIILIKKFFLSQCCSSTWATMKKFFY